MPQFDEATLTSFAAELSKLGAVPWQAMGSNVGALMGAGAGIGAGVGALRRGSQAFHQAKDEGASTTSALLHGAAGGLGGALSGGLAGGALGGLAGAAGTLGAPGATARAAEMASEHLGPLARFGQRQVHGITGWTPKEGLGAIRAGAWPQQQAAHAAEGHLESLISGAAPHADIDNAARVLQKANRARVASEAAEKAGLTNLPGVARAMAGPDRIGALRAAAGSQWHNSGKVEKALMVGVPMLSGAAALAGPQNQEHGRGERLGRAAGELAAGTLLGGVPIVGQMGAGMVMGSLGGRIGKLADRPRPGGGIAHRKPELEPANSEMHIPVERGMSPAAAGQTPEVLG